LKQPDETSDLPVGAVVLPSDGADNTGGVDADTPSHLRNRRIPIHTVLFRPEQPVHDMNRLMAGVARAPTRGGGNSPPSARKYAGVRQR
jgi:hypothetical protein